MATELVVTPEQFKDIKDLELKCSVFEQFGEVWVNGVAHILNVPWEDLLCLEKPIKLKVDFTCHMSKKNGEQL